MANESSVQLGEYVKHLSSRAPIRAKINSAKVSGDVSAEWEGRQQMKDYWSKLPAMRSGLLEQYNGDEAKMMTDVHAYKLLTEGKSF